MTQAYALQSRRQSNNPQFGQTDICQVLDLFQYGRLVWRYLLSVPSRLHGTLNKLIAFACRLLSKHRQELKEGIGVSTISYLHYTTKEIL